MTPVPEVDENDANAIQNIIEQVTIATGKTPSVLSIARHLGIANTTFRRRYPDVVVLLQQHPRLPNGRTSNTDQETARLRARNLKLSGHLELAIASIQRLSIENRALRRSLEATSAIVHLPRDRR